jgi:hypothetical protein
MKRYTPRFIITGIACVMGGSFAGGWLGDHGSLSPTLSFLALVLLVGWVIGPGRKKHG